MALADIIAVMVKVSYFSPIVSIGAGIWKGKMKNPLWMYVVMSLLCDIIGSTLKAQGTNIRWVGNLFFLLEFVFVSAYYYPRIFRKKWALYLLIIIGAAFAVATIYKGILVFNTAGGAGFSLLYIIFTLAGFYQMFEAREAIYLEQSEFFWVNVAFLLYASGGLLFFLFSDYLNEAAREYVLIRPVFFLSLNIMKNVLLTFAMFTSNKKAQWSSI